MTPSMIDLDFLKNYLRIDHDLDDIELELYLASSKSYIQNYTGLSESEMDEHIEFSIPILMLCSHFYENKSVAVSKSAIDKIFGNILNMHRRS